jgi:transforming growth factor-beta-induced protein
MNRAVTRAIAPLAILSFALAACGDDDSSSSAANDAPPATSAAEPMTDQPVTGAAAPGGAAANSAEICDADGLVAAVEGGPAEGTLSGMTDDPVATAASSNPVLTTLVSAVGAAGLGDTLNGAEELTVFAPTDCAFAALDEATLQAALDDPQGLLTQVLGFHVVPQRLSSDELAGVSELETFTGETLQVSADGETIELAGGQAKIVVPDIQTANATVYLIDAVMVPGA